MDFEQLTRHWDRFGATDPLWAILTDPARKGGRWSPDAFFATGRVEIAAVVARAQRFALPRQWDRALDFGCGVGRLTQALADQARHVIGVDVAPSMIEQARHFNRHGTRCHYEVNSQPDLRRWPDASFDIIYTGRVLQHMEPRYAQAYLREFLRLLRPGGYLSFDLPSEQGFFPPDATSDTNLGLDRYRARTIIADAGPLHVPPLAPMAVTVEVVNDSTHTWVAGAAHALNVGNHWQRRDGRDTRHDDQRVAVPLPWRPGENARVTLRTHAPAEPGRFLLQCDLVEEGRTWFADAGSTVAEIEIVVGGAAASLPPDIPAGAAIADAEAEPVMEMHAVPRVEVEALLRAAGVTLLDVTRVAHCGPRWLAFRYEVGS